MRLKAEDSFTDDDRQLFSLVMAKAIELRGPRKGSEGWGVLPGPLLVWARELNPRTSDLRDGLDGFPKGLQKWPAAFRSATPAQHSFYESLALAVQFAESAGIQDGRRVLAVLAKVSQILTSSDRKVVLPGMTLALTSVAPAVKRFLKAYAVEDAPLQRAAPPVQGLWAFGRVRNDEKGEFIRGPFAAISHATHIGPRRADKLENQDATFVKVGSNGEILFALADGVSTSYGSRYAAASGAEFFCTTLDERIREGHSASAALFKTIVSDTQAHIERQAEDLRDRSESEGWQLVHGTSKLTREVAIWNIENTFSRRLRNASPALCATLLGGLAVRGPLPGQWSFHVVRLGDGVVEVFGSTSVVSAMTMDRSETELATSLCPGPLGRAAVESLEYTTGVCGPDQSLLLSSDGLLRGHSETVAATLASVSDKFATERGTNTPLDVLVDAASYADRQQSDLFGDNLGLIVIAPIPLSFVGVA